MGDVGLGDSEMDLSTLGAVFAEELSVDGENEIVKSNDFINFVLSLRIIYCKKAVQIAVEVGFLAKDEL